jgi:serine protease Do
MTDFREVAEQLRRSTVQILADGFRQVAGSGIIWNSRGLILTNAHVLTGGVIGIELWDGTRVHATTIKQDERFDLTALQIAGSDLPFVSVGDSAKVRPGELAIAIGNPSGFVGAVSTGIVHSVSPVAGLGRRIWVQTNVRLAPGNSGGPLANARGEVIGVNTMIARPGPDGPVSLAIPAATAQQFLTAPSRPSFAFGVTVRPVLSSEEHSVGLLVLRTEPGGAAEQASLLAGDVLVRANGQSFRSAFDLKETIDSAPAGLLSIEFRRGSSPRLRRTTARLQERRTVAA